MNEIQSAGRGVSAFKIRLTSVIQIKQIFLGEVVGRFVIGQEG